MSELAPISRRDLLRDGAAAALLGTAALMLPQLTGGLGSGRNIPLLRSTFAPLIGQAFRMVGEGAAPRVVLTEIGDLKPASLANAEHRFSLFFTAPTGTARVHGIRTFHNPQLGKLRLYVTPVDRAKKALRYEAVINRK